MNDLRFAVIGAGFWSQFQLAGWQEVAGARCVALCDLSRDKAERLASLFGIASVYEDAREMLNSESLDFIDVVTDVQSHAEHVALAAEFRLPVICQKPMAPTMDIAQSMVLQTRSAGVDFLIHENWRWQAPLRRLKEILASGQLGKLVRARIDYSNSFPVFDRQPFLKALKPFILTDIGSHILDTARFLFGEATTVYCQTRQIHQDIAGEDVATVLMRMGEGITVSCNMSYASRWEFDRFPQTMVAIEGTQGGVSLGNDYQIRIYNGERFTGERIAIPHFPWADPAYALIHSSIVPCHQNLLNHLRGVGVGETSGEDNLRSLQLVFAAYDSSQTGAEVKIEPIN